MVNLDNIVKATGYSKATVPRVLSGDPSFTAKESTRHRVIQVTNELGYTLRSSRSGVSRVMAVLENFDTTRGPQGTYFADVRDALREYAVKNMTNLFFSSGVDSLAEAGDDFAGFVSLKPAPIASEDFERLHEALAHDVFIDVNPAPTLFHSVRPDLQQTVIGTIYALHERGYECIAFIGRDEHMMGSHVFTRDPRTFAFDKWARLLEVLTDRHVYASGSLTVDSGRDQAEILLDVRAEATPDTIFMAVDLLAVGITQALVARGVEVPEEVVVLSIDNLEVYQYAAPALSSYAIGHSKFAETVIIFLSDAIAGRLRRKHRVLLSTRLAPWQSFVPIENTSRN